MLARSCTFRAGLASALSGLLLALAGGELRATELHWTTNGMQLGVLSVQAASDAASGLDRPTVPGGHDFIGSFTLSYALWTLGGEPLHEFIFTWKWRRTNLVLGRRMERTLTAADLEKYPDLSNAFFSLKPMFITIETAIQFYDSSGTLLATARKLVDPGVIGQSGAENTFHPPGSPRWADFFTSTETDKPSRDELDRRHKEVFCKAARVELGTPRIIEIRWPENSLRAIVDELSQREGLARPAPPTFAAQSPAAPPANLVGRAASSTNAASTLSPAVMRPAVPVPRPNPFEIARQAKATHWENPLERAARLQAAGDGLDQPLANRENTAGGTH